MRLQFRRKVKMGDINLRMAPKDDIENHET